MASCCCARKGEIERSTEGGSTRRRNLLVFVGFLLFFWPFWYRSSPRAFFVNSFHALAMQRATKDAVSVVHAAFDFTAISSLAITLIAVFVAWATAAFTSCKTTTEVARPDVLNTCLGYVDSSSNVKLVTRTHTIRSNRFKIIIFHDPARKCTGGQHGGS